MTIGERLRKRRLELGMTQKELAAKVGYKSFSSIRKIEHNQKSPLVRLNKLADILECSPRYLLGLDPEHRKKMENKIRKILNDTGGTPKAVDDLKTWLKCELLCCQISEEDYVQLKDTIFQTVDFIRNGKKQTVKEICIWKNN